MNCYNTAELYNQWKVKFVMQSLICMAAGLHRRQVWIPADPSWKPPTVFRRSEYIQNDQRPWRRKRRWLWLGFGCDKKRMLVQVCKQWWPLWRCCNFGSFMKTGQHFLIKRRVKNSTKDFLLLLPTFGKSLVKTSHQYELFCSYKQAPLIVKNVTGTFWTLIWQTRQSVS